jgi:DNA-binding NarL/FixJ family response regulator
MKQLIKVLLADDHPMFLEGVRNALQKFAHIEVVAECTDGLAVEKYIRDHFVDVVVLDVNMPGKNGVELSKLIRKEYPHIKVVFLTMYHPGALPPENPVASFMHGYVLKNSGSLALCEAIETAFSGKTYLDPKLQDILQIPATDYFPSAIKLSSREKEIIKLVMQGKGNRDIAGELFLSELTIKTHRKNIYQKLEVNNVAGLIQKINALSIDLS